MSDAQYRQFRSGLPSLMGLALLYLFVGQVWRRLQPSSPTRRVQFLASSGLALICLLHGASALKILAILYANYFVAHACRRERFLPLAVWSFNIGILFANQYFNGYQFSTWLPFLSFLVRQAPSRPTRLNLDGRTSRLGAA
jgi:hypothetical protein